MREERPKLYPIYMRGSRFAGPSRLYALPFIGTGHTLYPQAAGLLCFLLFPQALKEFYFHT